MRAELLPGAPQSCTLSHVSTVSVLLAPAGYRFRQQMELPIVGLVEGEV